MGNQVGRVRFADGTEVFPVVIGSTGGVLPRLYATIDEAANNRDNDDFNTVTIPESVSDAEPVEVWEWCGSDNPQPTFMSSASKSLMLLTGIISVEEAMRRHAESLDDGGFWIA